MIGVALLVLVVIAGWFWNDPERIRRRAHRRNRLELARSILSRGGRRRA